MKIKNISEARRNPQHPAQQKETAYEQIKKYSDDENIFISYTSIDKLGINPTSQYNTPIGIYTYPLKIVFKKYIEPNKSVKKVPFAGNQPFIQVARLDNNVKVMNIDTYTKSEFEEDIEKLYKWVQDKQISLYTLRTDFDFYVNEYSDKARNNLYAGKIWNVTRLIASYYATNNNKKAPVIWSHLLFNILGYYGVIDLGNSIIHPSEPEQAVFFNIGALTIIDKVENKKTSTIQKLFNPESSADIELNNWLILSRMDNKNLEKFMIYGSKYSLQYVGMSELPYRYLNTDNISPEVEKKFIEKNPFFLRYIKNPKEQTLKWYAENKNLIDDTTPFVELYSEEYWKDLKMYSISALYFIKNPSIDFVNRVAEDYSTTDSLKLYAFLPENVLKSPEILDYDIRILQYITNPSTEQLNKIIQMFKDAVLSDDGKLQNKTSDIILFHYNKYNTNTLNSIFDVKFKHNNETTEYSYYQKVLLKKFLENKVKINEDIIKSFIEADGSFLRELNDIEYKITEEIALAALFTKNEPDRFAIKYINNKTLEVQKRLYDILPTYDKNKFFLSIENPHPDAIIYIMENLPKTTYYVGEIISRIIQKYSNIVPVGIKKMFYFDAAYASKFAINNSIILSDKDILDIIQYIKEQNRNTLEYVFNYVSVIHQDYIPDTIALVLHDLDPSTFIDYYINNKMNISKKVVDILLQKDKDLKHIFDTKRANKSVITLVTNFIFNLKKNNIKNITFTQIADFMNKNRNYVETNDKTTSVKKMTIFRDHLLAELVENGIEIIDDNSNSDDMKSDDITIGNMVEIISGPFKDFKGKVSAISDDKIIVSVSVFGKPVSVKLQKSEFKKL
jgi:hypothetical protein